METAQPKKLYRSRTDRVIAGVCGGLGEYFEIDPIIFRGVFILLCLPGGFGFLFYLLLTVIVPRSPGDVVVEGSRKEEFRGMAYGMKDHLNDLAHKIRESDNWFSGRRNVVGLIIVIVGLFLFVQQIFPFRWFHWNFFWPVLLIVFGVLILTKHERHNHGNH
jgi:phage shock protein C